MKKIYASTLVLSVAISGNVLAQTRTAQPGAGITNRPSLDPAMPIGPANSGERSQVLWEDDFDSAADWTVGYDGNIALNWQIGIGLTNTGDFPTQPINSPTQANGYAMLDSDGFNNSTGVPEASHMTNAAPFSTLGYPNVVLEFQTFYRKWTNEECYIVVSTNNTDWPVLDPNSTDGGPIPNVYEAFPGMEVQAVIQNPTRVRINISDYAGDQAQVWIRFYWAGEWGYSWFVDDVQVIEQPAYELIMEDGYLSSTGDGEEYGRIPAQHLEPTMLVGGNYNNFGVEAVTNANVSLNVTGPTPFSAMGTASDLASAASGLMDQVETLPNGGALGDGMYNATFTLSSDNDGDEEDLTNNVYLRNFEVNSMMYTLDGIDNHPTGYQALGSLGSNSFTDAADGLIMFNYYPMAVSQMVYGMEFLLTASSVAGGYVICSVYDTTIVDNNLLAPLYQTDVVDITADHIADGKVTVVFDAAQNLAPNAYFFGVTLFSNGGANHFRIIDDLTVPQPGLASGISIPADQVYSNGNAYSIRLLLDPTISVGESAELEGVSVYPNPVSDGNLYVRTTQLGNFTIQVIDMLGQEVLNTRSNGNTTLDMSGFGAGMYSVRVSNGDASTVQRVAVK